MPVKPYGVLKCQPIGGLKASDTTHYEIHVVDDEGDLRIAVNVQSQTSPPELRFYIDDNFSHHILQELDKLPSGFTELDSSPGGIALDYIRGNLFDTGNFKIAPHISRQDNELLDRIEKYIDTAVRTGDAVIYAFGQKWGPENKRDQYFGFRPRQGIHDIHMNQGNSGNFLKDNGVYQDGGLFINIPSQKKWIAIFLAFQSQALHTDDTTGNPIDIEPNRIPVSNDGIITISAALINTLNGSKQTVSLLNTSPDAINLAGWSIADKFKNRQKLDLLINPGAFATIEVQEGLKLPVSGGIITLLDNKGIKVHGVSYTSRDTEKHGWTTVF
ncbi:MAG TPA: DUF2278 family protein [Clostridia bacterium]